MTEASTDLNDQLRASATSNRILIAAIAGIIFLTLYPFRFLLNRHVHGPVIPFLLDGWGKAAGPFDVVLNILLFVPYGFGLALKFRGKGKSRAATLGVCLVAGALLSYTIELLQFYIPLRDSGWEDVFTNSTGSVVGLLLFEMCGLERVAKPLANDFDSHPLLCPVLHHFPRAAETNPVEQLATRFSARCWRCNLGTVWIGLERRGISTRALGSRSS